MRTLGLVGGSSWISTIAYYRLLNEGVNRELGGSEYARCVIYSLNFGDIQRLNATKDWDAALVLVEHACTPLLAGGAEAIVLCANTMHLLADRLQARLPVPIIHLVDATAAEISRSNLHTVALLGTKFTMEMDFFKERLARQGIRTLVPAEDDRDFVHATIFGELGQGLLRAETKTRYMKMISALVAEGAQGVVLGCTEIPLLITQADCAVPVFDTVAIHAAAAVRFAVS